MSEVQVIVPRTVALSDQATLQVRRTLPSRDRAFIGAWCFADHYGPQAVRVPADGMDVPPHPHTGLQTVSWLFDGHIEHRDSGGVHAVIHPGEINLMTSGHGIAHSEVTTPETDVLHGVQLWIALPERFRDTARAFQHHAPDEICLEGATALVFIGELSGVDVSPIRHPHAAAGRRTAGRGWPDGRPSGRRDLRARAAGRLRRGHLRGPAAGSW